MHVGDAVFFSKPSDDGRIVGWDDKLIFDYN